MFKYENEVNTLNLFKEGKITEYAFQQELSNFVGPMSEIHLSESTGKTTASSYGIFVYPEKHVNGIKIIYLLDKDIITNNFYTSEEIIEKISKLLEFKQGIIKEFFRFLKDSESGVVTLGHALAVYLRIYSSTLDVLAVEKKDFLPDGDSLTQTIVDLIDGKDVNEIVEKLSINNFLPKEVLETAKSLVHDSPENEIITKITFVTDGKELPSVNLGQQEIRDLCTSTFGTREHKEIKYDYIPATNQ